MMGLAAFVVASGFAVAQTKPEQRVNPDAAVSADFEKRAAGYMKLRQSAQAGLTTPKNTQSPIQLTEYQHQLADRIRRARPQAQQGDIFTPEIVNLFRHLVSQSINGPQGVRIRKSYERAEPIRGVHLAVNQAYPDRLPLQSMPPSLLLNLPKLPKELEYRFVDHELILRDIAANLIVDFIPDLTMPSTK
ncbi:MAG TPA: hypothetical protein VJT08_15055 [Terriglobales bacterium]|nr:hypothetical protein [Terriglobales bacterium]